MKNILFLLFTCVSFGQAGSFDASYGNNGLATICYPQVSTTLITYNASFQSSGKIVTYNGLGSTAVLMRWNTDGTIDTTFGDSGTGIQNYFHNPPFVNGGYSPNDMAIQSDDKIVIMGLQQNPTFSNAYWVARLLPDGALDTSFNGTGYLDLSFGTFQDRGTSVALQDDGKILVGGTSGNTAQYFTVARLNPDGSLDTGFGDGGKVQTPFSGNESFVQTIAVQPDGKIVAGGYTVNLPFGRDFAIVRYNADGSIDTDFGDNGKVITTVSNNGDFITELIIEPDGRITAGGYKSSENNSFMCMVRYLANGSIDASFGIDGIVINDDTNSRSCTIARQADGKYLMAGCLDGSYFLVVRYNSDGSKDSSFGAEGVVYLQPVPYGYAAKVLIQADNKIIACGYTYNDDYTEVCFTNVRLNPGTLSTDDFILQDLKLYPNPTTGEVFFRMTDATKYQCTVYNLMGQKVMIQENVVNGASVNIDNLPKGAYMFVLSGGGAVVTKTIILK